MLKTLKRYDMLDAIRISNISIHDEIISWGLISSGVSNKHRAANKRRPPKNQPKQ